MNKITDEENRIRENLIDINTMIFEIMYLSEDNEKDFLRIFDSIIRAFDRFKRYKERRKHEG